MGRSIELEAADGHRLAAYVAEPAGAIRGGLVVIQEIFGVNRHIRAVADDYAGQGFVAIAPALFDRVDHAVADHAALAGRVGPGPVERGGDVGQRRIGHDLAGDLAALADRARPVVPVDAALP